MALLPDAMRRRVGRLVSVIPDALESGARGRRRRSINSHFAIIPAAIRPLIDGLKRSHHRPTGRGLLSRFWGEGTGHVLQLARAHSRVASGVYVIPETVVVGQSQGTASDPTGRGDEVKGGMAQEPECRLYRVFAVGSGFAEPPRSFVTRPRESIQPSRTKCAKSSRGGNFDASNAFLDAWTSCLVLMISLITPSLAEKRPKCKPDCARQPECAFLSRSSCRRRRVAPRETPLVPSRIGDRLPQGAPNND